MFSAIAGLLGIEIKDRVSRLVNAAALGVLALILLVTAGAYLMGYARTKLLAYYDVATIDLMMFAAFGVVGSALAITAYAMSRPKKGVSTTAAALAAAPLAASVARSQLPSVVKAVPLVMIGGLLLGRHLAKRE